MSLAALVAFFRANELTILGLWLVLEQYLASNKKIRANSTMQLLIQVVDVVLKTKTPDETKKKLGISSSLSSIVNFISLKK